MEKIISALFDTDEALEAAKSAACSEGADADSIRICRAEDRAPAGGSSTLAGIGVGAAAGTVIGLGALALENMGIVTSVGPVAGLISGAVLGAIVGGFVDYEQSAKPPEERWLFTVSTDENGAGGIVRQLRRCGGDKVTVS